MANKAFEIQESKLRIGGVDLEAGTTSVVIPGVTQATSYKIEEIDEVDDVDQTTAFTPDSEVVVVDYVQYQAIVANTGGSFADFTATTDDEGYIDEIEVNGQGSYTLEQSNRNGDEDMYAYNGADSASDRPIVPEDWVRIPFRPKMRAGEVETIGGGGSLTVGNGTNTSVENVTEILINGTVTEIEPGLVGITVDAGGPTVSYKGFKAVYARMYIDEPTISKVLIYQDSVTTTPTLEVDTDTRRDLFKVSGLANSSVIALVNIYGSDDTYPTALSTLQHFAKSIIDNVILSNGNADTNIDVYDMRSRFYDNFDTFASRAGNRYKNFEFLREEWFNISGTGGVGTGATFNLFRNVHSDLIDYIETKQQGINYQAGDIITIPGASLGGTTPENNIVITVTGVGLGGEIGNQYTYTGILPANAWPLDNIDDGGDDQYDGANYIFTNIQGDSYIAYHDDESVASEGAWAVNYNGGNVNESGAAWFGEGSEYVTTYNDSIFGLFVTGANINWIATNGNSGFDGDGIADTGSLQLVGTDGLINGNQTFTLNANGSVTFPDGSIQTTAYTEGDPNVWVQDFEPTAIGAPTDSVASANSVEYLGNGDIVAVFQHYYEEGSGTYNTIGRFTPTGEKVWSMKFQGDVYTDGWGLAVNNDGGYIFLAGSRGGTTGYSSAVLTKLAQSDGAIVWSKTYDVGYTNSNVVVDMSGNDPIVVGYAYNGTDAQIVTTKIDGGTGAVIWSKALDGQGDDQAYGMAVDYNGIVTVGYIDTFGAQNAAATLYTDPASNPNWTTGAGISYGGFTARVDFTDGVPTFTNIVDPDGNRTVDGTIATFSGVSFGGTSPADDMVVKVGTLAANDTDNRMVVVKYDNNGAIVWQRAVQVEPGYNCTGADSAIDGDGNIYVCGNFDYDDNNGGTNQSMILIKFNESGTKKWTRKVQGPCEDYASSVVVGPDNCLYLSAYTASANNDDFSMVVAKYNLDGTVAWQRLLDSLTNWTFAGQFFFGPGGGSGSTIAVRDGYVAVVGGVANFNVYTVPQAIIAQFGTDGKIFTRGDYDFKAATFSGLLNTTASNITVTDAGKVSSDYNEEFTVSDFEPDFDLTSDLVGTVYRSVNAGNELVNGNYTASLNANGSLTLPAGGTVSEGYVTSNPTIQLTPARPDVASQKLVIKGGGIGYYTENGINVEVSNTVRAVGETLTVNVYSDTYANQTLYWWINPEGVGIGDTESGTVTLTTGNGTFNILVDSDDFEFRVRVSPEDHNYGPGVIGAQSSLINSGAPTFDYEHHLHLTTGNLAETSIFLGTDNHNVRTTTDGGIEITTPNTTNNVWRFGNDGSTTLPGAITRVIVGTTNNTVSAARAPLYLGDSTYPAPLVDGNYGPFTRSDIVFTVQVVGGSPMYTITNVLNNATFTLNQVIGTLDAGDLGGTPGNTSNIDVSELVRVPLDLTKSVNNLADGPYSLADGVEGQIMYLVRQTGSTYNAIIVNVANARIDGTLYTTIDYYPFDNGLPALNMSTLIFTDGAWQADNGSWD